MQLQNPDRIADHEIKITGRIVYLILQGDFREEQVRRYARLLDSTIQRGEPYVVISDVSNLKGVGPDARRYFTEWHKGHRCERVAVIGGTLFLRGIVSLTARAMSLTSGFSINVRFFSDEADAEAWIADWQDAQRGKY